MLKLNKYIYSLQVNLQLVLPHMHNKGMDTHPLSNRAMDLHPLSNKAMGLWLLAVGNNMFFLLAELVKEAGNYILSH